MSQARFQKQQREKARREKAAAKYERKVKRRDEASESDAAPSAEADQPVVLAELAALHERFAAGDMPFDEFLLAKEELTERLDVR